MKVTATKLPEVLHIEPLIFHDSRGSFLETFSTERYRDAGMPGPFVQSNLSVSRKGVLRGLHFQEPNAQGKLVHVVVGEVFDVAVDVRVGSPRFGQWIGVRLSSSNRHQLYVPPGFAHGFLTTSDEAVLQYQCTAPYHRASEQCIRWDDPRIAIDWPSRDVVISEKDAAATLLDDLSESELPRYA